MRAPSAATSIAIRMEFPSGVIRPTILMEQSPAKSQTLTSQRTSRSSPEQATPVARTSSRRRFLQAP